MSTLQPSVPQPSKLRETVPGHVGQARIRWARLSLALGALLLLSACVAPGMKLNTKPGKEEATTQMNGLAVTLRPLGREALKARTPLLDPSSAELLLAGKTPPYLVGPQDVLLVTVWDHPEITMPLGQFRQDSTSGTVVDEGGQIYFPHVGAVKVAGMTTSQVREALTSRLSKILQNPQVDVKVIAYRSQKVYVGGEVKNPALYNVTDVPFTLAEAINRAGGFLPTADDSRLLLTRGDRVWQLNFQALLTSGNRIGQILLRDGDSLQIPNHLDHPVYMLGELGRPGILPMVHGNLSLARALSEAGGILGASADARSIYVIRQGRSDSAVDVFHLDARNPTAMLLADRFPLDARDIVYVDAGTLVRYSRVMGLLLPTISTVVSGAEAYYIVKYVK